MLVRYLELHLGHRNGGLALALFYLHRNGLEPHGHHFLVAVTLHNPRLQGTELLDDEFDLLWFQESFCFFVE